VADPAPSPRSLTELPQFRALISMLAALAGLALLYLGWQIVDRFIHLLTLLLFAVLLAFVIGPAVSALEHRHVPRSLAVLGIYGLIFGGVALGVALTVTPLISQISTLSGQLPHYQADLTHRLQALDRSFAKRHIPFHPSDLTKQAGGTAQSLAKSLLSDAVGILTTLASLIVDVVLTLVISIYLLIDARRIHDNVLRVIPARQRDRAFFVEAAVTRVLGGYIRGQLLMALLIGSLAGVGCFVLGVQYPLVIGVLAGLFELMPMIGPVLGAVPAVGIAFFQSPGLALWVALYYLAIQQLEAHVIGPRITGHAVGLHPLGAIIALIAGVEVGGLLGALLGVPAFGILYVLTVAIYWEATGRKAPEVRRSDAFRRAGALVRRRALGPNVTIVVPAVESPFQAPHLGETMAGVLADLGGDSVPPPQALAGLDEQVAMLRENFERGEAERTHAIEEAHDAAGRVGHDHPIPSTGDHTAPRLAALHGHPAAPLPGGMGDSTPAEVERDRPDLHRVG